MDKKFREEYYKRLNNMICSNGTISISYLNISYLPGKFSEGYISNFKISQSILINLKKLYKIIY